MKEFMRFCLVGGFTFVIDYGLLYLLTEHLGVNYLLSSGAAFTIAVIINYILCLLFVFNGGKSGLRQLSLFIYASMAGLLLNQLCMWLLVEVFAFYYLAAKIIATAVVTLWNYVTKKYALKGN